MVLFTGLVSIKVPNFAMFLDFSGAFSMTFLAFIMPILMYQRSFPEKIGKKLNIALWVLIVFGSFCGIISAWESGK